MAERPKEPFKLHLPNLFFNYLFLRGWQLIVLFMDPVYPSHLGWQAATALAAFLVLPVVLGISTWNELVCSHHIHIQLQFPLNKGWLRQEDAGFTVVLFFSFLCLSFEHSPLFSAVKAMIFTCIRNVVPEPLFEASGWWIPCYMKPQERTGGKFSQENNPNNFNKSFNNFHLVRALSKLSIRATGAFPSLTTVGAHKCRAHY